MKNVYDNGYSVIGNVKDLKKYLLKQMNNADNDTTDLREMIEDLKNYSDDTIVVIDYDAPMGYTIEYNNIWSNDNIMDNDEIELNEEGEI